MQGREQQLGLQLHALSIYGALGFGAPLDSSLQFASPIGLGRRRGEGGKLCGCVCVVRGGAGWQGRCRAVFLLLLLRPFGFGFGPAESSRVQCARFSLTNCDADCLTSPFQVMDDIGF